MALSRKDLHLQTDKRDMCVCVCVHFFFLHHVSVFQSYFSVSYFNFSLFLILNYYDLSFFCICMQANAAVCGCVRFSIGLLLSSGLFCFFWFCHYSVLRQFSPLAGFCLYTFVYIFKGLSYKSFFSVGFYSLCSLWETFFLYFTLQTSCFVSCVH